MTFIIETRSAHETKSWGRRLASVLEGGELLGLMGDLGAGKTCFIKGLASGLNLREGDILSPTFTMIQEHHGRMALYHIDLYRLEEAGLVSRRKHGREVLYEVEADRLDEATRALIEVAGRWDQRLSTIKRLAEAAHAEDDTRTTRTNRSEP